MPTIELVLPDELSEITHRPAAACTASILGHAFASYSYLMARSSDDAVQRIFDLIAEPSVRECELRRHRISANNFCPLQGTDRDLCSGNLMYLIKPYIRQALKKI